MLQEIFDWLIAPVVKLVKLTFSKTDREPKHVIAWLYVMMAVRLIAAAVIIYWLPLWIAIPVTIWFAALALHYYAPNFFKSVGAVFSVAILAALSEVSANRRKAQTEAAQ